MKKFLLSLVNIFFDWVINMGFFCLVCVCFSWDFNFAVATGIWLVICIIRFNFKRK